MGRLNQGVTYAPQITSMENVSGSDIKRERPFMVKVLGEDTIELSVKLANMDEYITTTFDPGWNPEIVSEIASVGAGQIQIGY